MKAITLAFLLCCPLTALADDFVPRSRETLAHMPIDLLAETAANDCTLYTGLMTILGESPALRILRSEFYLHTLTNATEPLKEVKLILDLADTYPTLPWFVPALQDAVLAKDAAQCQTLWHTAFDRQSRKKPQVLEIPSQR